MQADLRRSTGMAWPLGLMVLAALAYLPALQAGFVYDDRRDILLNPAAQAESFWSRLDETLRPLLKASYALQDALGSPGPWAYHAVNLGLHLAAVGLVFLLLRRAAGLAGLDPARATRLAGMATAVWAVHPALAETVAYASGRSMGLSGLLLLACLWAATAARPRPGLALACAALAPLARETALVAPLLLAAWQLTLERETPLHRALVRAAPVWLGAACAALVILALSRHRELVAFSLDQRSPLEALRGNLFALPEILRLWVEPWRISVLPRQPVIYGWGDGPTLLRLAALAALPLVAWAVRRRAPLVALAILWTLLALAPTNSLIWRMDPVALRPLYLAGIGLSLLVALLLMQLRPGPAMALALAAWLASETWQRATLYQDEVALFADAAAKTPDEPRAQLMLGLVLANAGRFDEARAALTRALTLDPYLEAATRALRLIDAGRDVYATDP